MIVLCSEYLSARCIWLCVLIMPRTCFRVNPHSIVAWMSRNLNFRFRACFQQGVPWHSGNYRVRIHSETRTWHDKNIQSVIILLFIWYWWKAKLEYQSPITMILKCRMILNWNWIVAYSANWHGPEFVSSKTFEFCLNSTLKIPKWRQALCGIL